MTLVKPGERVLAIFSALVLASCSNIGLRDQLEDPAGASKGCGSNCRIFVTFTTYSGNLGGPTGADALCRSDSNNPDGSGRGLWKAMLSSGNLRRACSTLSCQTGGTTEHIDWALKPLTNYRRSDGAHIGTTSERGVFQVLLTNFISLAPNQVWTALNSEWQDTGNNCNNWTDGSGAFSGSWGNAGVQAPTVIFNGAGTEQSCANGLSLYCIEQ